MADNFAVTEAQAVAWLEAYRNAWVGRDSDALLRLFTPEASYRERRFEPAVTGHKTIRQYWERHVIEEQRDIAFDFTLMAVKGDQAFVNWTAHFTWLPINGIMELDAISRITFVPTPKGGVLASSFEEWIEIRDH
jgi:hypothetical protein